MKKKYDFDEVLDFFEDILEYVEFSVLPDDFCNAEQLIQAASYGVALFGQRPVEYTQGDFNTTRAVYKLPGNEDVFYAINCTINSYGDMFFNGAERVYPTEKTVIIYNNEDSN